MLQLLREEENKKSSSVEKLYRILTYSRSAHYEVWGKNCTQETSLYQKTVQQIPLQNTIRANVTDVNREQHIFE